MYIIGLDVGTTGTKAALIDEKGNILGKGYQEYNLTAGDGGRIEQSADAWWDAAVFSVREAVKGIDDKTQIRAIGMSTQGSTMVAVDKYFNTLCPAITWMDKRASKEAKYINDTIGGENGYNAYLKTGWSTGASTDSAKIIWMRENMKDVYEKAHSFVSTVEFMNFKLTGNNVIDPTNGTIRGLVNTTTGQYDDQLIACVGVEKNRLPEIMPTGALVGKLTKKAASELNLSQETEVYNGAHDQYCASLGSGSVNPGDLLLATGTTWVIFGVADKLMFTPTRIATGIHPVEGRYGALASMVSAGSSMKWFAQQIGEDYVLIDNMAAQRRENAKNVFFFPYLAGAGFPRRNSALRSSILGLELKHDKYDMALALMEAVAFESKASLKVFEENGMPLKKLVMAGGAAKSKLWREIVGYTIGCEMYLTKEADTCCIGAGMIAAVGCGIHPDFLSCAKEMVRLEPLELKEKDMFSFYKDKFERYSFCYEKIKPFYEEFAKRYN